ncbi:MAG: N-acetylmuramoyl-L-alanine amidase [Devosiaceae bacterium]|nr:N-acetylmuramoyl-L-alanine amidase [Devosiaceae bacterium]
MKYLKKYILLFLTVFLFMSSPLNAQQTEQSVDSAILPSLIEARVSSTEQRARLVLDLSAKTVFALTSFNEPMRIAVDVKATDIKFTNTISPTGEGLISSIDFETTNDNRIRTWLVLSDFAQVQQAYILDPFDNQPARLVVDIIPASKERFLANVAQDIAFSQNQAKEIAKLADNSNAPGTLNSQITSRPLIIIDPGHGGIDSGAQGATGHKEKDIVLNFALLLQKLLIEAGSFDVALTRNNDSFVSLPDRLALARTNKADLFISIHADSFEQADVGGTSIYTIDEEATDVLDKILADNENKVDIIAGLAPPNIDEQAVSILVDLMRRQMRKQAFRVASVIVDQLKPSVRLRRFPIRKADFFVLQSPDIPSILIELGFLSNMKDVENLTTSEWNDRVANSIARGVAVYFGETK